MGPSDSCSKWVIPSSISNLPQEGCSNPRSKHFKKPTILSVLPLFTVDPKLVAPCVSCWGLWQCRPLRALLFWHTGFILGVVCEHECKDSLKLIKRASALPVFDIGLSSFCLVIVHSDLWFRLVVSRCYERQSKAAIYPALTVHTNMILHTHTQSASHHTLHSQPHADKHR